MKRKFSKILGVGLALALALSLVVMAAPVAALTAPVVTVAPTAVGQPAEYTIVFTTAEDLAVTADDDIRVEFPEGTIVPGTYVPNSISIEGTDVVVTGDIDVDIVDNLVTIDVPEDVASGETTVIFKLTAVIENPSVIAAYTLEVSTSREVTPVTSAEYNITAPPGPVDLYDDSTPLAYVESYDTISEAITAASSNYTIKVHADTYAENLVIPSSLTGITLESYDGPATTIIDASGETDTGTVRGAVQIWANNATLGGDGVGFTIIAPDATLPSDPDDQYGVEIFTNADGVTVEGNTIRGSTNTGSESPQVGIHIWQAGAGVHDDITIKDNTLTTTYTTVMDPVWAKTSAGIVIYNGGKNLKLEGNTIDGYSVGVTFYGLSLTAGAEDDSCIINDNTVKNCDFNGIEADGDWFDIYENQVFNNGGNGVAIVGVASPDGIDVYKNTIYGNGNGVKVYTSVTVTNVHINYNDIYSNTNTTLPEIQEGEEFTYENYGVFNDNETDGSDLDAKYNFWSDPNATPLDISGPSSATYTADEAPSFWAGTALGTGDIAGAAATDADTYATVIYNPWLSVSYETVVDEGIRYYGSDTLTLQAGWNTLSVPLKLYDYADTIAEIEAMGDFLTTENYADYILEYDPAGGGWLEPTTLVPCRGYYIKMLEDSRFPVLYSNSLGLPKFELAAGWNLIGSAFGIDKLSEATWAVGLPADAEAKMLMGDALDSIGAQASVVVSPSAPGQIGSPWSEIWAETTTNYMQTGEGYWVFMTDTGTLAGFEITPFYFTQ